MCGLNPLLCAQRKIGEKNLLQLERFPRELFFYCRAPCVIPLF